jgi:hypothetical protein
MYQRPYKFPNSFFSEPWKDSWQKDGSKSVDLGQTMHAKSLKSVESKPPEKWRRLAKAIIIVLHQISKYLEWPLMDTRLVKIGVQSGKRVANIWWYIGVEDSKATGHVALYLSQTLRIRFQLQGILCLLELVDCIAGLVVNRWDAYFHHLVSILNMS